MSEHSGNDNVESGCSYTDGAQYVGCQVAEKGWPSPMMGGKKIPKMYSSLARSASLAGGKKHNRRLSRKRSRKAGSCGCVGGGKRGKTAGGLVSMLGKAVVPFGLLALQKKTHRKRNSKQMRKSYKKRSFRKRR